MSQHAPPTRQRPNSLELAIAWRHLRARNVPRWARLTLQGGLYALIVGIGMVVWAVMVGGGGELGIDIPGEPELAKWAGVAGAGTIAIAGFVILFALYARWFSALATIVTFGVLLGSMALVIVLSLMSGLEGDLRDKILAQKAHIRVSRKDSNRFSDYQDLTDALSQAPGIAGASPYLQGEVMVRSGLNRQGAVLYGVVPELLASASELPRLVVEGKFEVLEHPELAIANDPLDWQDDDKPFRLRHLDEDDELDRLRPRPSPIVELSPDEQGLAPAAERPVPTVGEGEGPGAEATAPRDSGKGATALPQGEDQAAPQNHNGGNEGLGVGLGGAAPPKLLPSQDPSAAGEPGLVPRPGRPLFAADTGGDELGDPDGDSENGDGDDDWEDPVEVLDLPDPPDPAGAGGSGGSDGGGSGSDTGGGGDDPPTPLDPFEEPAVLDALLIGRELSMELAVHAGARVQLITPVGRMTPAGRIPGVLASRVGAVFYSGWYEADRKNVYATLPTVQAFLRAGDRISGIDIKLDDVRQLAAGKAAVERVVAEQGRSDELVVETWQELNRNLFSAMLLEKIAMFIGLLFVVLVASFGILASNLMSVLERSKEIAILKAMGAADVSVQRIFVAEGLCVGSLGAMSGITIGLVLCWALNAYGLPMDDLYIERLPVHVEPIEVVAVAAAVLVIVWLSSLYPAWVAARTRPVDGLRHTD